MCQLIRQVNMRVLLNISLLCGATPQSIKKSFFIFTESNTQKFNSPVSTNPSPRMSGSLLQIF